MREGLLRCVLVSAIISLSANFSIAADYDHETKVEDMTFAWKVDGANLHVKLSADTTGWIGIGFNPEEEMKGANYILGYVKGGKVKLTDDYGDSARGHKEDEKLGGTTDVTAVGGEEKGDTTTIEFTIPLDSGDKYDSVLTPDGDTVVLLAYGGKRDSFKSKHKFRKSLKVNLATGKVE